MTEYDTEKVDEMVLALLYLKTFEHIKGYRTWKSLDWSAMERLHQKGLIGNPTTKSKSAFLTEEGHEMSKRLFEKYFGAGKPECA